ncbi:MAG: helix-turn-helix transcriptional regulator [Ahniella sp.]|nr:helix-turn-helix transcriptional regulator [Ahniella sp.]
MASTQPHPVFQHGQFLGAASGRRSVPGFELAALRPTVPEHDVHTHTHADAHLVLLLEGRYITSARGAASVCTDPTLIYNPPGTCHRDRFQGLAAGSSQYRLPRPHYALFAFAARLPDDACILGGDSLCAALHIAAALTSRSEHPLLSFESWCAELLSSAARLEPESRLPPPWLLRIRELLHDACGDPLELQALAGAAGVHSVHLTRAFRRHFRCTPGDYLRRCRLTQSAALLANKRLSLTDIALSCGFSDQAHFSRSFGRAYGVSPSAYRAARQ